MNESNKEETGFFELLQRGLVREPTSIAMLSRLTPGPDIVPSFLDARQFQTLIVLCERLRPKTDWPSASEIAFCILRRLESGDTDGWRYEDLPSDRIAYAEGLVSIDREAESMFGLRIEQLGPENCDAVIRSLQANRFETSWPFPPARFLEELLAEVVTYAYSHPLAQDSVGYRGYADAKGWAQVGLNGREAWEA